MQTCHTRQVIPSDYETVIPMTMLYGISSHPSLS